MSLSPNPWIEKLPAYEPGRPLEDVARELGLPNVDDIIKLASNENALGPSPLAIEAMCQVASRQHLYPDGDTLELRRALATHLSVTPDQIMPGNGSNELIELIGHAYLKPGDEVVVSECSFAIYRLMAFLFQAKTVVAPMQHFTHDLEAMRKAITPATRVVFIANPNNPTGTCVEPGDLIRFIEDAPPQVLVVIDEAYVELMDPADQPDTLRYVREARRVCVLRTFSKAYGLAGLRVGYAVAPEPVINALTRSRQPFNVNAMAQTAAIAALKDEMHVQRTRTMVREGLTQITAALDRSNIAYVPSKVNFLLIEVGHGRRIFEALQREHVIVRPMDGYGLPRYIRVTVGTRRENECFLTALEKVLERV